MAIDCIRTVGLYQKEYLSALSCALSYHLYSASHANISFFTSHPHQRKIIFFSEAPSSRVEILMLPLFTYLCSYLKTVTQPPCLLSLLQDLLVNRNSGVLEHPLTLLPWLQRHRDPALEVRPRLQHFTNVLWAAFLENSRKCRRF